MGSLSSLDFKKLSLNQLELQVTDTDLCLQQASELEGKTLCAFLQAIENEERAKIEQENQILLNCIEHVKKYETGVKVGGAAACGGIVWYTLGMTVSGFIGATVAAFFGWQISGSAYKDLKIKLTGIEAARIKRLKEHQKKITEKLNTDYPSPTLQDKRPSKKQDKIESQLNSALVHYNRRKNKAKSRANAVDKLFEQFSHLPPVT